MLQHLFEFFQRTHFDLDRLGVTTGDEVTLSGPRGTARLAVVLDDAVPRGAVQIAFGSRDADGHEVVRALLDPSLVVAQVRLETQ